MGIMYIRTPNTPSAVEPQGFKKEKVDNITILIRHSVSTQTLYSSLALHPEQEQQCTYFVCTLGTILSKTPVESKS